MNERMRWMAPLFGLTAAGAAMYLVSQADSPGGARSPGSVGGAAVVKVAEPSSRETLDVQLELLERYRASRVPLDPSDRTPEELGDRTFPGIFGSARHDRGPARGASVYATLAPAEVTGGEVVTAEASGRRGPRVVPLRTTTVDEEGSYALELPTREVAYRVDVGIVLNGFQTAVVTDVLVEAGGTRLDLTLSRGLESRAWSSMLTAGPWRGSGSWPRRTPGSRGKAAS